MRHGGTILVQALKANRVERVFSVPGESFLAALDGLHDSGIQNIVCRHEGGAAMMAEAAGKLSGRPGVAFVTRGPGATNASAGVHVARQDSTPMILFVGQIARGDTDRDAFQEVDFRAMFGPPAKWVAQIDATNRIAEYVRRAFAVAMSGRPGPVVLALPEDMLSDRADIPDLPAAARPLPEAGLATYRVLEQRAAAMAPGWTIEVEPPVLPLPDLALDQDGAPANADSLALALWAAQRIGLPIDIAVRGDDHSPLVQPFADRGVDARLTDGASADRAALRWRVAE